MIEGTPESDRNWLMLLEKRGEKKKKVERGRRRKGGRELESGGLWQGGDRCDLGLGAGNQAVKASVYAP